MCAVRTLYRHRDELVQAATQHTQHMHKALTQMNLQIHHVISDLTGTTGLAIVDAILAGERDAAKLAALRDHRIKASEETIRRSLVGNWLPEHLFTLKQAREAHQFCLQQMIAWRRGDREALESIRASGRSCREAAAPGPQAEPEGANRSGRRRAIRIRDSISGPRLTNCSGGM